MTIITNAPDMAIQLVGKDEPRVDTRILAEYLGLQHRSVFALVTRYKSDFQELGHVRFEIAKLQLEPLGGRPQKYALLNEDQSYLLLTYSRNTARVRGLKVELVKAFKQARNALELHRTDYLPTYHGLHDQIKAAGGDRFQHINFNRAINQAAGLRTGERGAVGAPMKSLVIVGQMMAMNSIGKNEGNLKHAYRDLKGQLIGLANALPNSSQVALQGGV
ncbi:Rha family transcriptional regulator [Paenalcaligenes sp. Me52]|uniref:Rha family transcriptional regulator n=1 Tax=Paenalcaligenes sp. Me52 TaxID=3392038 RepID=UPI003D2C02A2